MGEAKKRRDREYQEYLKSLNNGYFTKLREEIYPQKDKDGLIPNTWYVMTKGSRSVAFYKGMNKKTIGINPTYCRGTSLNSSAAWFTSVNMRADNVIPANVKTNILPKLIACAKEFGYHAGRMILHVPTNNVYQILGEETFFLVNDILYCKVEALGGYQFEISLIKNSYWNIKEYKPC